VVENVSIQKQIRLTGEKWVYTEANKAEKWIYTEANKADW
jgi:hypothetical protein